jgi:hypothetical protein
MKRSAKLLDAAKSIKYWLSGYHHALWYRGREVLTGDDQRQAIREADDLVMQAQRKLDAAFGPAIGQAMLAELND